MEALSAVAAESRGRLATALLALLNSASETELRDVLAGIGAVRARLIVETRSERLFESLDDAFGRIGLSAKQASNLTLANLRQILASRPGTSPRKRDGARARRSYRKSGRVLARKEGDDDREGARLRDGVRHQVRRRRDLEERAGGGRGGCAGHARVTPHVRYEACMSTPASPA